MWGRFMKIYTNINNINTNDLKAKQNKKDRVSEIDNISNDTMINNAENKNIKLNSYNISNKESKIILNTIKESFNNINFNIENLFSGFNNDNIISLLKETN